VKKIDFLVDKKDITQFKVAESLLDPGELLNGQVLLKVDHFAFTANNITYASLGEKMHYWDFFPTTDHNGIIPVWGFAEVIATRCDGIEAGERFYGYYPMSTHLIVEPNHVQSTGFLDGANHRRELPPVYNQYLRCATDPLYRADNEPLQMLLRPLFLTSFLIDDFLADNEFFSASQIILTSASSKTAIALAYLLKQAKPSSKHSIDIMGLTSKGNVEFVKSLGYYDHVLDYGSANELDIEKASMIVDFAGNGKLLADLYRILGTQLKYSCMVGLSHWDEFQSRPIDLPNPQPVMFFAPSQAQKRIKEWGGAKFQSLIGNQWNAFAAAVNDWLDVEMSNGPEAARIVYKKVLGGAANPKTGQQVSMFIQQAGVDASVVTKPESKS
jgi:hypothetical protein